jgi:Transposase
MVPLESSSARDRQERRQHPRKKVEIKAELHVERNARPFRTKAMDLTPGGCFADRAAFSGNKEKIMAKRREKRERRSMLLEPDAAGIDIGAEEIFVAVPPDRDEESTRRFSSFTCDLHALADWLGRCRIQTVAMESTGVYWIRLFQILEERGFKVYLVNAHYLKSVPGRKSDVSDCQWIQYLHSVGLLRASFRPPDAICALRTLWRHRGSLLENTLSVSECVR